MLSHLYRMAYSFRRAHGMCPNLVYLNRRHYAMLRRNLEDLHSEAEVARFLGMDILICPEIEHPDVAWVSHAHLQSAAGQN